MSSGPEVAGEILADSGFFNVQLTDALRKYVDERASDKDVYATPSEYIRDLIRQDMQDRAVALNTLQSSGTAGSLAENPACHRAGCLLRWMIGARP
ncbi:MAG TPA: hypothetical protein VFO36_12160 [Nitrospiraceae bacterium]|nr:hypothetical protein [Nitrospiraceae bacterium]